MFRKVSDVVNPGDFSFGGMKLLTFFSRLLSFSPCTFIRLRLSRVALARPGPQVWCFRLPESSITDTHKPTARPRKGLAVFFVTTADDRPQTAAHDRSFRRSAVGGQRSIEQRYNT